MLTFAEYLAKRQIALPDPVTMLRKAGIDPGEPHEVEVQRMVKREKKAADRLSGNDCL